MGEQGERRRVWEEDCEEGDGKLTCPSLVVPDCYTGGSNLLRCRVGGVPIIDAPEVGTSTGTLLLIQRGTSA
eukprot:161746-Hanusia_phi.AAC.2